MQQRDRRVGYLLVLAASLLWSTNGLAVRQVLHTGLVSPRQMAAVRVYGATLILAPFVLRAWPRLGRGEWLRIAAFGVFGVSLPQWLYFEAIARVPVPIVLVIVYTAPVIVTAYERVFMHRRLPRLVYLAIVGAIAGVILAVTGGAGGVGAIGTVGLLLAVACTFSYAGQIAVASVQPRNLSPLVRTGLGMAAGSVFWMVASPFWRLPFASARRPVTLGPRTSATVPLWIPVVYVTVIATVVAYTLFVSGTQRIGAGAASVTGMIEPVAASAWAWLALDQRLTAVQVVGILTALVGVSIAEWLRNRQPSPSRVEPHDAIATG